ncbi:hypothetical protein [Leptospira wolffii]|uniref:hypothetical protein n=1 Tax=Leptospira wolffii TaxID=409998 RepID=UPI0012EB536D|nr:hypothetical protein [Leptospira wolffii]
MDKIEKLKSINDVVNSFKSESVQLRVLEYLLEEENYKSPTTQSSPKKKNKGIVKKQSLPKEPKKKISKKSRPGPGQIVDQLISEGFFNTKKSTTDIVQHCSKNLAYNYKANEIAITLTRSVRNGKLNRKENSEGTFEYQKA